ncbi:S8 family peptidase [Kordiimonas sp.]|uniref:S8 family peptidase n=1 Tax=Kordiimonas sp. TaxID=1970157 RepID=UPI003B530239
MTSVKICFGLALGLSVAACGGGGSAMVAPPTPSTPEPPQAPSYNTTEYRENPGLGEIGALAAYDEGLTGAGVTVALMDSGVDVLHPDLDANIHPESKDFGGNDGALFDDTLYDISENPNIITPTIHGTMTAGIIAAERNDQGTHGVAPEAQILALRMDLPELASWGGKDINLVAVPGAIDHAIANDARILMVEWAFWDENSNQYAGADNQIAEEFYVPEEYLAPVREAFQKAIDAGMLIVIPAGNEFGSAPTAFISQLGLKNGNQNAVLVVGAVDRDQTIFDRSNKAGYAQDYFVVAPSGVTTTLPTHGFREGRNPWGSTSDGTSFAGPHVAGAAVLLMQAFPNLTAKEVGEILLASTTDLGVVGSDEIYGQGLINLERALAPMGATASRTRDGREVALSGSVLSLSPVFGDAVSAMPAFGSVSMLDGYRRAYRQNMHSQVQYRDARALVEHRLNTFISSSSSSVALDGIGHMNFSFMAPTRRNEALEDALPYVARTGVGTARNVAFSFSKAISAGLDMRVSTATGGAGLFTSFGMDDPQARLSDNGVRSDAYASLFDGALGMALNSDSKNKWNYSFAVSRFDVEPNHSTLFDAPAENTEAYAVTAGAAVRAEGYALGMDAGVLRESGSFLGAIGQGALNFGNNATTVYAALYGRYQFAHGWQMVARYSYGVSSVDVPVGGFVEGISAIHTDAFAVELSTRNIVSDGDRLGFSFSQPLRARSGELLAYLPTGQTADTRELTFERVIGALAPSKRQLDTEITYEMQKHHSGLSLQANILLQQNPGHRAGQAAALLLRANLPF